MFRQNQSLYNNNNLIQLSHLIPISRNMLPSAVSSWNFVFIVFRCAPFKASIYIFKKLNRIYKAKFYWWQKISLPPACGRQNQPTERKNGKKINLILPEHCHGDTDTCSWICIKKKCHKGLGYSFCKPRNAQAWREGCQGWKWSSHHLLTALKSLCVLAETIEIIIHHLSSPIWAQH